MEIDTINQQILSKLNELEIEIRLIREKIEEDGELTDWAKNELAEARKTSDSEYVSHEAVKNMLLAK